MKIVLLALTLVALPGVVALREKFQASSLKEKAALTKCVARGISGGALGMMISWGSANPVKECGPTVEGLTYEWQFSNAFSVSFDTKDTKCVCSVEGKAIVSFKAVDEQESVCDGSRQGADLVLGVKRQCWDSYKRGRGTRFREVGSMRVPRRESPWRQGDWEVTWERGRKCIGKDCNSVTLPGVLDDMSRDDKRRIGVAIQMCKGGKKIDNEIKDIIDVLPSDEVNLILLESHDILQLEETVKDTTTTTTITSTTSTTTPTTVDCDSEILKLVTDTITWLMASQHCGLEEADIMHKNNEYTLTSVAKEKLCNADCGANLELVLPLGRFQDLVKHCIDGQSLEELDIIAPGYAIATAIWKEWIPCHEVAPTTTTSTTTSTTIGDDVDDWVDLSQIRDVGAHVMSCGPREDSYIEGMLNLLHGIGSRIQANMTSSEKRKLAGLSGLPRVEFLRQIQMQKKKKHYASCMTSCITVYSKFSECIHQDDSLKCTGLRTGVRKIGPSDGMIDACDSQSYQESWIQSSSACASGWLRRPTRDLLCSSLYDSRKTDKNAAEASWDNALSALKQVQLKKLASKHHVILPFGSSSKVQLDCRNTWCEKVNALSLSDKDTKEPTLASCSSTCERRYLEGH